MPRGARRGSAFKGDHELVFANPKRGWDLDHEWYAAEFRKALAAAGITDYVRPFHDARHALLTNGAALAASARADGPRRPPLDGPHESIRPPGRCHVPDATVALEIRLLRVESSTPLSQPQPISAHLNPLNKRHTSPSSLGRQRWL
jgi:hypothetical protein